MFGNKLHKGLAWSNIKFLLNMKVVEVWLDEEKIKKEMEYL